jgi:pimeloyl-ACP methyl ester carboxylesterase
LKEINKYYLSINNYRGGILKMLQRFIRTTSVFAVLILFLGCIFPARVCVQIAQSQSLSYEKEMYTVPTDDGFSITLYRYVGEKRPSIMLVPGICANHFSFDYNENHSLARFLNAHGWDVWMLDARTHDGDGDFWFGSLRGLHSDREYINRYWDLDNTYLKKDVVAAAEYIKKITGNDKFFFLGHSLGGYLAYAYAELVRQDDLAGIITLGSSAKANPFINPWRLDHYFGIRIGQRAYVRPFGLPFVHNTKYAIDQSKDQPLLGQYYENTTSWSVRENLSYMRDDEAAGLWVDMMLGRDPRYYGGHWVDPQTLFDYTAHLNTITVPFLVIAGDEDTSDPKTDIYQNYQNVSSTIKKFVNISGYAHMDLILGDTANIKVFPEITNWLDSIT